MAHIFMARMYMTHMYMRVAHTCASPGAAPGNVKVQSNTVKSQLNLLMIGFREITRQVSTSCCERGMLLDKIWKATSSLLDYVVQSMQDTILACEQRMNDLNLRAGRHEQDMLKMKLDHDATVNVLTQSIGHKWGKRVEVLKQALLAKEYELQTNNQTVQLLTSWFPGFLNYAPTVLNKILPAVDPNNDRNEMELMVALPEEALLLDLERIVAHTLMDTKLVKVDEEDHDNPDAQDEMGDAELTSRLTTMLTASTATYLATSSSASMTRGNERNELIFRNLMSASREYQSEIVKLNGEVEALQATTQKLTLMKEQELKATKKREATLHHLVLASALTVPHQPPIQPTMSTRGSMTNAGYPAAAHHPGSFISADSTKIINVARTQRDCIRYIKQYAEFESERLEALLTTTNLPNSNTWWMLKLTFHDFVKQQIMMKNPDDFHLAERNCGLLERSCVHWATHHNDEAAQRMFGMFSKLLKASKSLYTPRQEALWLHLSNQLHGYFKFAFDDDKPSIPNSLVPTNKAQKALKRALLFDDDNELSNTETSWRKLPEDLISTAVDKIYKASGDYEGLNIEMFSFIEITIDYMSRYENEIRQAVINLCHVASGADDMDSVDWSEFNIILDIVEPTLPNSMRLTLFHRFSQAAVLKEGKKWESQALADTLLHYSLPMDRLFVVHMGVAKTIKLHLETTRDACINNANEVIDQIITSTVEEDEIGAIRELEKRVLQVRRRERRAKQERVVWAQELVRALFCSRLPCARCAIYISVGALFSLAAQKHAASNTPTSPPQVKQLTADALGTKEKNKLELAHLACLFLGQQTKKARDMVGGDGGDGKMEPGGFSNVLSSAIKFDTHFLLKSKFNYWRQFADEQRVPRGTRGTMKKP